MTQDSTWLNSNVLSCVHFYVLSLVLCIFFLVWLDLTRQRKNDLGPAWDLSQITWSTSLASSERKSDWLHVACLFAAHCTLLNRNWFIKMEFRCTCTEAFLFTEEKKIYLILNLHSPQLLRDNKLKFVKMHSKNKTQGLQRGKKRKEL